ncbi:putative adhesin [Haloactinopolyspora alba]|uniref:Putative adhesin n=1 Tax=Haloactinopolyspora alba TaxID=648780 RepID=A0A2P8E1I8_9ACTN|nr:DUF4097 family beta strand repeat-containing protein [Haloactinopolyspora alba]PSL03267.1 putative adhesin [Haloactinopolyspora alba]
MTTFTTPGPISAIVEVAGARVRLTASDRPDTVVLVEPIDPASRKDVKVAAATRVELADGRLSVKTTKAGDKSGSAAITIELPAGSDLAAYLWSSDVRVDGPVGTCEVHMASGQVRLDRVGALQANLSSGEIAVGRIAGRAGVQGATFKLRIDEADGTVGLENAGGHTWIGHASGDVDISSGSGDFGIDRADGNVAATIGGGTVRVGRMTNGRAKLMNGSGDIEVGVGEGAAVSVDADSERGAVHDFVSSQAAPGPADAKVSVHARTRHGDITVQRAAA